MVLTTPNPATASPTEAVNLHPPDVRAVHHRIVDSAQHDVRAGGYSLTFQAMGTHCRASYSASGDRGRQYRDALLLWVATFEARYSRFREDSFISQINREAGSRWVNLDAETERLLALCHELVFLTQGIFDPTSLPLIALWNWKDQPANLPTPDQIAAARGLVGWRKLQRRPGAIFLPHVGMSLDLGGMGKEYAVDQAVMLASSMGVTGVLVDFGADIRVSGPPTDGRPSWYIGLEDPRKPGSTWKGLALRDGAVASSGDYFRKFEVNGRRYGHIVDPRTGEPVHNTCLAVNIVAPTCTQAGMLSTAAFVLGAEAGLKLIDAQPATAGAIVTDSALHLSRRFHEYVIS